MLHGALHQWRLSYFKRGFERALERQGETEREALRIKKSALSLSSPCRRDGDLLRIPVRIPLARQHTTTGPAGGMNGSGWGRSRRRHQKHDDGRQKISKATHAMVVRCATYACQMGGGRWTGWQFTQEQREPFNPSWQPRRHQPEIVS